jgi:hypothetical protein
VCTLPESRDDLVAEGPQAALQVQGLRLLQVQPHRRKTEGYGSTGNWSICQKKLIWLLTRKQFIMLKFNTPHSLMNTNYKSPVSAII